MTSTPGHSGPPPVMPASLRSLVDTVECLTHSGLRNSGGGGGDGVGGPQPPPHTVSSSSSACVASTSDLLQLVDTLQRHYASLLELAERAALAGAGRRAESTASPHSAHRGVDAPQAPQQGDEEEAVRLMEEIEATAALLQDGIRSKGEQATRLVLLNTLRREVAERRQCVAKMEGVLSVARQHIRLDA